MKTAAKIAYCRTGSVLGAIIAPSCYGISAVFAGYPFPSGNIVFLLLASCMITGIVQVIARYRMGIFPVPVAKKCLHVFFYASILSAAFSGLLTAWLLPLSVDRFVLTILLFFSVGIWSSVVLILSFWKSLSLLLLYFFFIPLLTAACLMWPDQRSFLLIFGPVFFVFMNLQIISWNSQIVNLVETCSQLEKRVRKLKLYNGNEGRIVNEAKNEFLANMSHELRTPMHSILSFARLGLKRKDSLTPEKQAFYFNMIMTSGQQLLELLNDLLELSTAESKYVKYHFEWSDLGEDLGKIVLEFQGLMEEKGIRFIFVQKEEISIMAWYDKTKIRQVLRNLLSNALKFTDSGKKVVLQVERGWLDQLHGEKQAWKISIIDQGIGIEESELECVFEKFMQGSKTRTGAGGKGLGLAICKQIIEDHGGVIWAEKNGTDTSGAVISFLLPAGEKECRPRS